MLRPRSSLNAVTEQTTTGWHLEIPAGEGGKYRLAQIDNYSILGRKNFPIIKSSCLSLNCRVSSPSLPGTWGFGFWNDPFALSAGLKSEFMKLPALPNACWFFNASPENHLSFHNNLRGSGFLAQTFRSPKIPSILLLAGIPGIPLLLSKQISKLMRAAVGRLITEDSRQLIVDTTKWHAYSLSWDSNEVCFTLDGTLVFRSDISPRGPLSAVIWIDNQYASWNPAGEIRMGTLPQKHAGWIEIEQVTITTKP